MDRRVEVVDELRADGWLCEHELHGRLRVARVAIDDADEGVIGRRRLEPEAIDGCGERVAKAVERLLAAAQVVAGLAPVFTRVLGGQPLRGVPQTELVRLFNRVAARSEIGERFGGLSGVRAQTQISVSLKSEI